ncbi:MAG: transketolase [Victivallaceae bacterium]
MKDLDLEMLEKIAGVIKQLGIEAIQRANSGHPGMILGCAEIAAYLYGMALRINPKNVHWLNRDRFVLSAGHGSMLLYSCLHLVGFELSIEDIQNFRRLHSKTPGHPEFGLTPGVEATTGPLGQGLGNAVGMSLGLKILASEFNQEGFDIFDSKVFCLCGDGCLMEGVSHEVCSFAGHLELNNLILIYDSNDIILDGPLSEVSREDTKMRFQSYGWLVYEIDGYDLAALHKIITELRLCQNKPVIIIAHTVIGRGSSREGSNKAHGSPLGEEGVKETKDYWKLSEECFYVPQSVKEFFKNKNGEDKKRENDWNDLLKAWSKKYPELHNKLRVFQADAVSDILCEQIAELETTPSVSGRAFSNKILNFIFERIPNLYGGSADLSSSDGTYLKGSATISRSDFSGHNIKYGIREFGMGTIMNGLAYMKLFTVYGGTFLVFSDYLRNAVRLAAISGLQVIYQFTHDSIFIGEDGPTHQPIEQIMSLRAIPGVNVIRPADANEIKMAWVAALCYDGPTVMVLSRQNLPTLESTAVSYEEGVGRGAYILLREKSDAPDYTIFATGSEVIQALEVARELIKLGKDVRVVSMPCWEIFEKQTIDYKESVVGGNSGKRISIEAGSDIGWYKYIGRDGLAIGMDSFGVSGAPADLAEEFGFTTHGILERILS